MTEDQLTALLRLKRYEKPDPAYFEGLLRDLHRRQRAELLHRPLWKLTLERMQAFFSEHSMGNLSYATAMSAALVVGVGAILVLTPGEIESREGLTAASAPASVQPAPAQAGSLLSLQSIGPALPTAFERPIAQPPRVASGKDRRYVIDARPVSYEPESSTRF